MSQQNLDFISLKKAVIEKQLSNLNDMQKKAALITEGPLLILAGAGSGKTTVLINRIANLLRFGSSYENHVAPRNESVLCEEMKKCLESDAPISTSLARDLCVDPPRPWEIMAITFTNKAAGELKSRLFNVLGDIGTQVNASTFHSACMKILRYEIQNLGYKSTFVIYDSDDTQKLIKECLKALNLDDKTFPPRTISAMISTSKDTMETPPMMADRAKDKDDYRLSKIAAIYQLYQQRLSQANALDFDDIITLTVKLFLEHPQVLKKYQQRCKYIMVDEYQDTNISQYRLVSLLAGGYGNICVVGDDDQSIYRFRGATIENILSFERQFDGAQVIRLEQNYRSTQNILDAANKVIENNSGRKGKTLWTSEGVGEKLELYCAQDEREEAGRIADKIAINHKNGGKYSENAVLYRLNAQSASIESALVSAAIPYKVVGGTRFLERKEVKDVMAYLNLISNHADTLRLSRIINEPKRGIGDATIATAVEVASVLEVDLFEVLKAAEDYAPLAKKANSLMGFARLIEELTEYATTLSLTELLDMLVDKTGYGEMLLKEGIQGQTRLENIEELKTTMQRYVEDTEESTLSGFLEEMALYSDMDSYDQDSDAVTLMTLHGAKGLEFSFVYIPGMEEGIFPSSRAFNEQQEMEEERRLAYVGITRAKKELTILYTRRRMLFGKTLYGRVSRFVSEIPPQLIEDKSRKITPFQAAAPQKAAATNQYATKLGIGSAKPTGASALGLAVGDKISHRVFGTGYILSILPMGGDHMVEIKFDTVGTKKIMATYARLTKI